MEPGHWLSLFAVCLLGAMSPGPSLAVVMASTLHGGPRRGLASALAHGLGVGLYGLLTVTGLALLLTRSPLLFLLVQLFGAAYLLHLGYRALRSARPQAGAAATEPGSNAAGSAAVNGFLVAFLNPKLAVFMLALFSQFLSPDTGTGAKALMVATVGLTDAGWYSLVVALVSHPRILTLLRARSDVIDRVFGTVLLLLGVAVLLRALLPPGS